jgi:hypothetical protein
VDKSTVPLPSKGKGGLIIKLTAAKEAVAREADEVTRVLLKCVNLNYLRNGPQWPAVAMSQRSFSIA